MALFLLIYYLWLDLQEHIYPLFYAPPSSVHTLSVPHKLNDLFDRLKHAHISVFEYYIFMFYHKILFLLIVLITFYLTSFGIHDTQGN